MNKYYLLLRRRTLLFHRSLLHFIVNLQAMYKQQGIKTQTKIAAIFFLFSLCIIILLSGSVYYSMNKYAYTDFYKRLEIRAAIVARSALVTETQNLTALREIRDLHLGRLPQEKEYIFKIQPEKNFEKEAKEMGVPMSFFHEILTKKTADYQRKNMFYSGVSYKVGTEEYAVVVSAESYYNSHHLAYIRNVILVAIGVTSLFALSISVLFSKHVFTPVINITKKVKEIGSQNLHVRLETPNVNDEIGELTATFNNMLDRLETAFETQNNFISNASHELSTPLTTIIGEADLTLSKERNKQEYVDALTVILAEAERLDSITKSLLLLAQTGFNGKNQTFEKIRVDQLLCDVKDTIDKINPTNKVSILLNEIPENPNQLKIMGNKQLLHLAISNIVTNACKYSQNQPVEVTLVAKGRKITVGVKDKGIGIPDSEMPFIYDPFFRASNTVAYKGYGIGMPLTRNIMRIHQGEIKVASAVNAGTSVELVFPLLSGMQANV